MKNDLMEGKFKLGERIVESKLAVKYGVSRGPVREAIRLLERDSLLERKNDHIYVVQFSEKDVIDIYQCRKALDSLAAELASKRITDQQLDVLYQAIKQTEKAHKEKDSDKVIRYNTIFHEGVVSASGNETLIALLESLRNRILFMRRMRNTFITHQYNYEHFLTEHKQILEAIANRQPALAKQRMENHINSDIEAFKLIMSKQKD